MRWLFLLITILFARDNPFAPVVINKNTHKLKPTYFQQKQIILPSDARILKDVTFRYQTLTGSIKTSTFHINKAIDWHNPILIKSLYKPKKTKGLKIGFLHLYINKNTLFIKTTDPLIRNFLLVEPFRYVLDFKADKDFLTYTKDTHTFITKLVLGNHEGFYRLVIYLDGAYNTKLIKQKDGYLVEFQ
ncbi:MAG: AMIN domain-containing protein [Epsilonproteobacteria bacterium]|nr:AMIN domain-containing protein [Campylobacterota bacterium]